VLFFSTPTVFPGASTTIFASGGQSPMSPSCETSRVQGRNS
jgi:hypothetical protein